MSSSRARVHDTMATMTVDARASMFDQLRGYDGFESVYQGKPVAHPIVLSPRPSGIDAVAETPNKQFLDAMAAGQAFPVGTVGASTTGLDPYLVAGLPVPMFSTVLLYLPLIAAARARGLFTPYQFRIYWRMRSFETQRNNSPQPFHGRNSSFGPDNNGRFATDPAVNNGIYTENLAKRYPMIVACEPIRYIQAEPTNDARGPGVSHLRQSLTMTFGDASDIASPLFPTFVDTLGITRTPYGQMGQGLVGASPLVGFPSHIVQTTMAKGDEMFITVTRDEDSDLGEDPWDFSPSGPDYALSAFLGRGIALGDGIYQRVDAGVFVSTGLAP